MEIDWQNVSISALAMAVVVYSFTKLFPAAIKKLEEKQKEKEAALSKLMEEHKAEMKERDEAFHKASQVHEARMDKIMQSHELLTSQVIRESEKNREIAMNALDALNRSTSEIQLAREMNAQLKPLAENAERIVFELKKIV